MMDGGSWMSFTNWSIFSVASPSGTSGAKLNEIVTAGICPWWFTAVGPMKRLNVAKLASGTKRSVARPRT